METHTNLLRGPLNGRQECQEQRSQGQSRFHIFFVFLFSVFQFHWTTVDREINSYYIITISLYGSWSQISRKYTHTTTHTISSVVITILLVNNLHTRNSRNVHSNKATKIIRAGNDFYSTSLYVFFFIFIHFVRPSA